MKIVVTGSLGNVSKPLTQELVQKGHAVTVVSSNPERQAAIEALGAKPAIGTIEDVEFLTAIFTGADAVYCMVTATKSFFDQSFDITAYTRELGNNYMQAILKSGVKRVMYLSTIGAHMDKGNGLLAFHYNVEKILEKLPPDVAITFIRPVGFYNNLLAFINTIKTQRVIATNYGGDVKNPWVSPMDIATAAAEEMVTFAGRKVRYVASDEISCNVVATVLGAAIGEPDLKWIVIPDEQLLNGMVAAGMNPQVAAGMVEMNESLRTGKLYEDYYRNKPALGKVKLADFAKEFAAVYHKN